MLSLEGLHLRAALFRSIRSFFFQNGFLEVDTPVRQPVIIPESNIQAIKADSWYLQTSPEQCMKRLLAQGCSRIFQICPCFRAGERGKRHLEEFTMLEWYRNGGDYRDLMRDCQDLLRHTIKELSAIEVFQKIIDKSVFMNMDFDKPWKKIGVREAFATFSPISVDEALAQGRFDEMLVEYIEPHLGLDIPDILLDYPAECASLALLKDGADVAERFELYMSGIELANGYSELTDPDEQRLRFLSELERGHAGFHVPPAIPERFLEDLASVEKAAGIAFGVDRLLMLIVSASCIGDVVSFSPGDW